MTWYLVTGGAGFIGSHVVEQLLAQGEQVRVLDNFTTGRRQNLEAAVAGARARNSLEVVEGDVRRLNTVRRAMAGVEQVVHLAAMVSVQQSLEEPLAARAVNANGTLHVLQAAQEAGARSVVMASSCAVYGDNEDLPLQETDSPRPLSPYAVSKLAAETSCRAFALAYNLSTACLRYFNVYGPRQNPDGDYAAVIPKFVERMKAGQRPIIYGDGRQTRDFVYVGDVVQATLLAGRWHGQEGCVLNVASGRQTTLLELVAVLNELLGTELAPEFRPAREGEVRHSAGDPGRMALLLGFRAGTTLAEGLARLVEAAGWRA
jgi:UDP-glucose 4-epimerase